MWYLISNEDDRFYLEPNIENLIGRKRGQIILKYDDSISKIHASICVLPKSESEGKKSKSKCVIKDMNSKYGTFVLHKNQWIKVPHHGCKLKNQDKIRIGLQQHIFTVVYVPIVTVTSSLEETDKSQLCRLMDVIDGDISNKWTDSCTHVTVSTASLTEKVVYALVSAKPVVTVDYWDTLWHIMKNGEPLPDVRNFIPPVSESMIDNSSVSLYPDERRKTLFRDLTFVYFITQQYNMFNNIISLAGGTALMDSNDLTIEQLCEPNTIVVHSSSADMEQASRKTSAKYASVCEALSTKGRKTIPMTDVLLAILHCSTERYCNPKFKFAKLLLKTMSTQTTPKVLVEDTQDVTSVVARKPSKGVSKKLPEPDLIEESVAEETEIDPEEDNVHCNGTSVHSDVITLKPCKPKRVTTRIIPETLNDLCSQSLATEASQSNPVAQESNVRKLKSTSSETDAENPCETEISKIIKDGKRNQKKDNVVIIPETVDLLNSSEIEQDGKSVTQNAEIESEISVRTDKQQNQEETKKQEEQKEEEKQKKQEKEKDENIVIASKSNESQPSTSNLKIASLSSSEIAKLRKAKDGSEPNEVNDVCSITSSNEKEYIAESSESEPESTLHHSEFRRDIGVTDRDTLPVRTNVNSKRFRKIPVKIPEKRVKLSDMYIWEKSYS